MSWPTQNVCRRPFLTGNADIWKHQSSGRGRTGVHQTSPAGPLRTNMIGTPHTSLWPVIRSIPPPRAPPITRPAPPFPLQHCNKKPAASARSSSHGVPQFILHNNTRIIVPRHGKTSAVSGFAALPLSLFFVVLGDCWPFWRFEGGVALFWRAVPGRSAVCLCVWGSLLGVSLGVDGAVVCGTSGGTWGASLGEAHQTASDRPLRRPPYPQRPPVPGGGSATFRRASVKRHP